MMNNQKDQMHPEDFRNFIIFCISALAIWFLYETYILTPQKQALNEAKKAHAEFVEKNPELLKPVKDVPRDVALKNVPRITFENDNVKGSIPTRGVTIDDLALKEYFKTLDKKENVVLFSPYQSENARIMRFGWMANNKLEAINVPDDTTQWQVVGNQKLTHETPVTLQWNNGQGLMFERVLSLDEHYMFNIVQRVTNTTGKDVVIKPYASVAQKGIPEDYTGRWIAYEGPMGFIGDGLEQMNYATMVKEPRKKLEAETGWIGISDKYWLTALIPTQERNATYSFQYQKDVVSKDRDVYQTDFVGAPYTIAAGETAEHNYHLYAGAKRVLTLEQYQADLNIPNFDLAVDFGWFWFFTYPFFLALHYLSLTVGNIGIAIIMLTILIRSAVYPLTRTSYRSFAKMKIVTPMVKELRDKHNDDKEKLQAEIVKLYQKEGVNPMSGCLPILIQIPIFFAFYKILLTTIEIRHAPFYGWIDDLSARDPTNVFNLFGVFDFQTPDFMHIGAWPCMMLLVMLVQKKLNPPPQDKIQRDMMNIFPFMITFVMAKFAAGLVIYWTFSALVSVLQQAYIMRSMGVPIYLFNKDKFEEEVEDQVSKGADVHPLIEMAEEEAEEALFGDEDGAVKGDMKPPKPKKKKKKK